MKFRAMIRHPSGVVRIHKVQLRGGVFKARVGMKKIVLSWDKERTVPYEKKAFFRWRIHYLGFYDSDSVSFPLTPPFGEGDLLPVTDQTRALRHLSEYAESRAIEALKGGSVEMLYVIVGILAAALGTGILVYFAMKGGR